MSAEWEPTHDEYGRPLASGHDRLRVTASSLDDYETFKVADVNDALHEWEQLRGRIRAILHEYSPPGRVLTTDPLFAALLADLREVVS